MSEQDVLDKLDDVLDKVADNLEKIGELEVKMSEERMIYSACVNCNAHGMTVPLGGCSVCTAGWLPHKKIGAIEE